MVPECAMQAMKKQSKRQPHPAIKAVNSKNAQPSEISPSAVSGSFILGMTKLSNWA